MRLDREVADASVEPDPARRIERILDAVTAALGATTALLALDSDRCGHPRVVGARGIEPAGANGIASLGIRIAVQVIQAGTLQHGHAGGTPPRGTDSGGTALSSPLVWLAAPVSGLDGLTGALCAFANGAGAFADEAEAGLVILAGLVSAALREQHQSEQARRALQALRSSERDYRQMVDEADDIIYRTDPSGFFTFVNPRVEEILGRSAAEIVGTNYLELIRPDFRPMARRFYIRQFARRIPSTYREFPALARDGREVWIGQHVRLVEEHGEPVGVHAVARDISVRKHAEELEHDRLRIVEAIARNAPLAETLLRLLELFERRAPGWKAALVHGRVPERSLVVAPAWPGRLVQAFRARLAGLPPGGALGPATRRSSEDCLRAALVDADLAGWDAWSIPIRGGDDEVAGFWAMVAEGAPERDAETTHLVRELVQLAALAVEHERLTERLETRVARARTLNRMSQVISSSLDIETVLREIARAASTILGAPVVRFWMIDEAAEAIWLAAEATELPGLTHGIPRLPVASLRGVLGWVARHLQALNVPDASADPRVVDAATWARFGLTSFFGQPIVLDGRLLAVLVLWGREPFAFDDDQFALLDGFVSHAALAIRNAQLYQDTDRQRQHLQSLVEVSQRLSRGLDLREVLDAITEASAAVFGGEAGLRLLAGDQLVRAGVTRGARQRPTPERFGTVGGLVGEALQTGRPVSTPDASTDERIPAEFRSLIEREPDSALLLAPILHEGRILGTLHIYRERGYQWPDEAIELAAGLADQAGIAIHNATRYAGLQASLERARVPARVHQLVTATLDLDVLLREIAAAAVKVTSGVVASLWLADDEARVLDLVAFSDETLGSTQTFRHAIYGEGAAGWVALHRQVLDVPDVFEDGRTAGLDWWRDLGLKSSYTMPILHDDDLVAVLSINGREPFRIGADDRELLDSLVAQAAGAIRNAALYREAATANRSLEQEVRRNELLLNSVADGVFGVDSAGCTTFVNPAAQRLLGYTADELHGEEAHARLHHADRAPDDPTVEACPMLAALRRGEHYRHSDDVLWRKDGRPFPVECVLTPLTLDDAAIGAVVTFRDISREKEAERQRRALAQSEKLRALGQLAGGIAHDLNQSLGLVVGHAELALDAVDGAPGIPTDLRESLTTIMQGALDGAQTVKRLQTFVRGQPDGEAERLSLGAVLADVVRLTAPRWRDMAQASGAPVKVDVARIGDDEIVGWAGSLREALTNLVFNALDAMPTGGSLTLASREAGEQVIVEITDSGAGMSADVAARIFEPFFTTKGERGTGLGLSMVYGIVERHGGKIEVDTALGRGTTIRIAFPRATARGNTPRDDGGSARVKARTILIVDDEEALRRVMRRMLEADGHTVVDAASAANAVDELTRRRFDLVLSDHGLGLGLNGIELATVVRERWPGTRFILVTGWGSTIDPGHVAQLGVEAVLSKPYRQQELRRAIAAPGDR